VALALAPGCAFRDLGRDVRTLDTYGSLRGTVSAPEPAAPSIVVLAISGEPGAEHVDDSFALVEPGDYFFVLPAGRYRIAAFADRDGNGVYDPGVDPVATARGGAAIEVAGGRLVEGLDLALPRDGAGRLDVAFTLPPPGQRGEKRLPEIHVGEIVSLDDPRFARDRAELGLWQPVEFLFEVGAGIYFLEPYDPEKIPVLFVHGALGTPDDFRTLIDGLDRERFQPWVFHYPTAVELEWLGRGLERWMERLYGEHRFRRLVVVGHSMGGLVARSFLDTALRQPDGGVAQAICLFVTISTPWGGLSSASFGVDHAPAVAPSWRDLAPGSSFLASLLATPLPARIPHHLLFGFGGESRLAGVPSDGVVALSSQLTPAAQQGASRLYGFDESHTGILRAPAVSRRLNELLATTDRAETAGAR